MTSKREILMAICEVPGWVPPEDSSSVDRSLAELQAEGWIAPRLDGFEATPQALDGYPQFYSQVDIADTTPLPNHGSECVPLDRVANLVGILLCEVPLPRVLALASTKAETIPADVLKIAYEIAQGMRR